MTSERKPLSNFYNIMSCGTGILPVHSRVLTSMLMPQSSSLTRNGCK
ncbi:hypothetical protein [Scytonema sp. NUACC26]